MSKDKQGKLGVAGEKNRHVIFVNVHFGTGRVSYAKPPMSC